MVNTAQCAESGIPGLDQILHGGLPRNQVYLLYGHSGSGKTTLSLQFLMEGARRGERCLYIGTSETKEEILEVARSHGWSLEGVTISRRGMSVGQEAQPGPSQTMLHPAEVELPRAVESLIEEVEKLNPTRVVIDSLSEIRLLSREKAWFQRQLMTLKQFFQGRECTVLLTDIVPEESSVFKTIVHGILEMGRVDPTYGPDRNRLRIEKLRAHPYSSGYHDYRIVTGGLRVFPRLVAAEYRPSYRAEQMSSGLEGLDRLLGGGPARGSSTLLSGAPGTGKSTLATQFATTSAARGEKVLIYCFDERAPSYVARAEGLGMPIERYMHKGLIEIRTVDPAELTAGELSHQIAQKVMTTDTRMVVIDSLNGYAYALPNERFLSVHLHELASFLGQHGVLSLFTLARHAGQSPRIAETALEVSYVADTVIDLRFFEHRGSIRTAISASKRRGGEHEHTIRELTMDSGGLHIGPVLEEFEGLLSGTPRYYGKSLSERSTGNNDATT